VKREDIRLKSDQEKERKYEEVDALFHKGREVTVKEHKSGFPAVTVDCGDIHLLTDCLSLESWWARHKIWHGETDSVKQDRR